MKLSENRFCPECGEARAWDFGLQRHTLKTPGGATLKIVHVKFVNAYNAARHELMVSLLVNGRAQTLDTAEQLRALDVVDAISI